MLIGEVSRRSGVSARMLRHYDAVGLLAPTGRTSGGYREYTDDDIRRLFHIESLRTLGLSLREVGRALDEPGFAPAALMVDLVRHTRERVAAEQELLATLEQVDATAPQQWEDVLHVVALLRALDSESVPRRLRAILTQDGSVPLPVAALAEAALAEEDPNLAGALHWTLARAAGEGVEKLAAGLRSGSVDVRRRAIAAIAEVQTATATAALRTALYDADATVRARAALALGSRGADTALPELVEMIVEGRRDIEAAEVLGALSTLSPTPGDVVVILRERYDSVVDGPVRLRITQALAEIPGFAARGELGRLTRDDDPTVAATAAAILRFQDRPR